MFKWIAGILVMAGSLIAEVEPDQVVEYKQTAQGPLTLHVFNPPNHKAGDKVPAIVFFFGGGWRRGTPTQFYPQSKYLASRGMVAICADYRTEENETFRAKVQETVVTDGKIKNRWVGCRPIPGSNLWFETAWADFRNGRIYE